MNPSMQKERLLHEADLIRSIFLAGKQGTVSSVEDGAPVFNILWETIDPPTTNQFLQFDYIKNPTGTVRWFFPKTNAYPTHLALYNSAHFKARVYKLLTSLTFKLGLKRKLFSGGFTVSFTEPLPLMELLDQIPHDSYAVFTGTVGENRKSVIALNQGTETTHFIKLAHTLKAERLLEREVETLALLRSKLLPGMVFPRLHAASHASAAVLSNVKPPAGRESAHLEVLHIRAIVDIALQFKQRRILADTPFFKEIQKNLSVIERQEIADSRLNPQQIGRIAQLLQQVYTQIDERLVVQLSLAHGDFTPWNMYLSQDKVHVYDWELARQQMPLLYDWYHFIYQSGVLLIRQNYQEIQREIKKSFRLPGAKRFLDSQYADPDFYHRLYLLHVVSYYLKIYMEEPQVHMQVHWLLDVWEKALKAMARP